MPDTVYISSTYEDLKEFRQAVIHCVQSLSDHYTPVGMEFYEAEDIHFVEKCLKDVLACDIYILLMGKRYGYVPKGSKKSITELEYEAAVAGQKAGKKPRDILVFKVSDFCNTYNYKENAEAFVEYQQDFVDEVTERLSPKPFDSKAELQLQVSMSLMKRVFRLIGAGVKVIPPDKDAVLCFCDRKPIITSLKLNVLLKARRVFFLQGDRMKDYPGGIVKRFARFSLGSANKVEPFMNITSLSTSCDIDNAYLSVTANIIEYIGSEPNMDNVEMTGFVEELGRQKSRKVILPFYYDAAFDTDFSRLKDFLCFLEALFTEYKAVPTRSYELYILIMIYSQQPEFPTIKTFLAEHQHLNQLGATIDRLSPVSKNDILDWIEAFISGMEQAPSIYSEYFEDGDAGSFPMQAVNGKLDEIIDDLRDGKERIKKYL